MARLQTLRPQVATLQSRIAPLPADETDRSSVRLKLNPWRAWYNTRRWRQLRWHVLERELFTCCECRRAEPNTSLLVADHIRPHRGNPVLFWDETNLQCMCKQCHDTIKQARETAAKARGE